MDSPCRAVPEPCGSPMPSGAIVMSQDAISAGVAGRPSRGPSCANAEKAIVETNDARSRLRIDMAHLPFLVHRPAGDTIGVIVAGVTALRDHGVACPLHIAGIVGAAALQDRRPPVPSPWHVEAHRRLGQDLRLDRRLRPALAAVGRDLDLAHDAAAAPGPGQAWDLVVA